MIAPDSLSNLVEKTVDYACQIQQIPSKTFFESERANYIRDCFLENKLSDVHIDATGNVLGCLKGGKDRPIIISAHLDTVHPMNAELPLERTAERITGPGIGDNSIALASLISLSGYFIKNDIHFPGDIWFAGNVCEEGLGNLRGMKTIVDRFQDQPLVYLVLEGMGIGRVFHQGIGVSRYHISVTTAGGHSWSNYGLPSAVHELSHFVDKITQISLSTHPRTTLNVGVFQGGTAINTIASNAAIELDLRSADAQQLKNLVKLVKDLCERASNPSVKFEMQEIGSRPVGQIPASHPVVEWMKTCLVHQGIQAFSSNGSTDSNEPLSRGYVSICTSLTTGGSAHTVNEFIEIKPLEKGLSSITEFIEGVWLLESGIS